MVIYSSSAFNTHRRGYKWESKGRMKRDTERETPLGTVCISSPFGDVPERKLWLCHFTWSWWPLKEWLRVEALSSYAHRSFGVFCPVGFRNSTNGNVNGLEFGLVFKVHWDSQEAVGTWSLLIGGTKSSSPLSPVDSTSGEANCTRKPLMSVVR